MRLPSEGMAAYTVDMETREAAVDLLDKLTGKWLNHYTGIHSMGILSHFGSEHRAC